MRGPRRVGPTGRVPAPSRVLLAFPRGLLADVIELALRRAGLDPVRTTDAGSRSRDWDVAVLPAGVDRTAVRARRIVVVAADASAADFDAMIDAVRWR